MSATAEFIVQSISLSFSHTYVTKALYTYSQYIVVLLQLSAERPRLKEAQ